MSLDSTHAPVSSPPPSFLLPDESVWKRYSPHQECPLSFGVSVLLHLTVAMIIMLGGVLVFSFDSKSGPPELELVSFGGGGGSGEGVGNPDSPIKPQDAIFFDRNAPDSQRRELETLDSRAIEQEGDRKVEEQRQKTADLNELTRGLNQARGLAGDKGKGGDGAGGGKGRGIGKGDGDGVGDGTNTSPRFLRQKRWTIVLPREDPEAFVKKLMDIQAILLIPDGDKVGTFLLCEHLGKRPVELKPIDQLGINSYNRLWYMSHDPTDTRFIATGLYLKDQPRWMAIFIPQELEQEMLRMEFAYKKLSEGELNRRQWITVFDVDRRDNTWDVRVRYQGKRPTQK